DRAAALPRDEARDGRRAGQGPVIPPERRTLHFITRRDALPRQNRRSSVAARSRSTAAGVPPLIRNVSDLPMPRSIVLSAAASFLFAAGAAVAAPASAPHAAACVAALKAQEASLADSMKAGNAVEPELLKVVRSGIAIIGTQY